MRNVITIWVVLVLSAMVLIAQAPVPATLSENEELKLVNTYQSAVLAQLDYQTAKQRVEHAAALYSDMADKLKESHKWPPDTKFEINAETGKVLVHLPPTKSSQTPHDGTKENH